MNKRIILLLIISVLLFSSCSLLGVIEDVLEENEEVEEVVNIILKKIDFGINEEEVADEMVEKIITAINQKDKEALKDLFSNEVLEGMDDFDGDYDNIINFIDGEIVAWEMDLWCSGQESRDGKKKTRVSSWFFIETDSDMYRFYLNDNTINTINAQNQGIISFQIIKEEDAELTQWQDGYFEGIKVNYNNEEKND